jgi:hypothetical protein
MNFESVVRDGRVVLEVGDALPEGTAVRATLLPATEEAATAASPLGQRLMQLAGIANDLPPDMAAQHDHYLHGQPKR